MRIFKLFLAIQICFLLVIEKGNSCTCIADPYSKKYIYFTKTWYGTKRKWTCDYTCEDQNRNVVQLLGVHEDWFTTDKGLEGICDGLVYVNRYNNHKMDFVWIFEEARPFYALDSTSTEIKEWGKGNCGQ